MPLPIEQPLPMNSRSGSLPKRFPVGAKYVVEGRGGTDGDLRVLSRYVVLPTGRRINVRVDAELTSSPGVQARRRSRNHRKFQNQAAGRPEPGRKKIVGRAGTARQHGR